MNKQIEWRSYPWEAPVNEKGRRIAAERRWAEPRESKRAEVYRDFYEEVARSNILVGDNFAQPETKKALLEKYFSSRFSSERQSLAGYRSAQIGHVFGKLVKQSRKHARANFIN
ncbi:hypothetical protein HY450_00655 [Candidatus Pacearchaeota archaeon]|nr:hypothetical protein [Candidatus Pacearchaeota archaeon]